MMLDILANYHRWASLPFVEKTTRATHEAYGLNE